MTTPGEKLADAALRLVGTPYRLHGHEPRFGLDCVGLLVASMRAIGRAISVPDTYRLRNTAIEPLLALAEREDATVAKGRAEPGDVLLVTPGPAQHHILIAADATHFVHAHASLRRVVSMPGPSPWPCQARWRLL
ncbi:NlpC/P60 family protein [Erythrobacter litoralis]|uniref:NlpC/P60 domain-containing protein n=1 Tax=Erythrobacter litoralis (strain HTCC2594) TaxID=314225 RepID=Q2N606_ERYLH|nr:NlpC/P60 family protein [Erythrobacter litoralis]ABC64885.1 hypothetical protein ELI_13965 [Erythrobacter litoralis HTCC2594]